MDEFVLRDRPDTFLQNVLLGRNGGEANKWAKPLHPNKDCLLRAIESATDVHSLDHFHAWVLGPFNALLSHEYLICMEVDNKGATRWVECLLHFPVDAALRDCIRGPIQKIAFHLLEKGHANAPEKPLIVCTEAMGAVALDIATANALVLQNAVILPARFLRGEKYFLVLFNVNRDCLDFCEQYYRILLPHLKTALSRIASPRPPQQASGLTQKELEVLRWMGAGKSNREIRVLLGISSTTLKNHINKIYRKLNVQSRCEAVAVWLSADPRMGQSCA